MPRPFDPQSLAAHALSQIRPPMGIGAVVWRYTVLVPFEEVRADETPTVLITDDDLDRVSETLCNHFGGVTIRPPLKGWGLRNPADPISIEFNTSVPHVVYAQAIKASDEYFIRLQQELQACLDQGVILVERQEVFLVG
jgi:hypothetical protein